jgi:type IV secretion system protein VirD4
MIRSPLPDVAHRLNALDPDLATQLLKAHYADADFANKFLISAWETVTSRMQPLLTETLVRSLSGSDFTSQDVMTAQTPITVYLRWPERDLLALAPLVRLMWGSLIDGLITTYDQRGGQGCHPVLLLIDEAGRTAIPSLADHATTVVGRGITLWIAVQSLAQLDVVYGKDRATVLRDNMDSQLFYRPSNQETADYLEHCLGRRSEYARSQTLREGEETSEGRAEQGIPLMTAWEIKQLKDEEIIGFHRVVPPFRATRMDWRHFPILVKRQLILPPEFSPIPKLDLQLPLLGQAVPAFPDGFIDPDALLASDSLH